MTEKYIIESKWWLEAESNCRHADFQSAALPTELSNRLKSELKLY